MPRMAPPPFGVVTGGKGLAGGGGGWLSPRSPCLSETLWRRRAAMNSQAQETHASLPVRASGQRRRRTPPAGGAPGGPRERASVAARRSACLALDCRAGRHDQQVLALGARTYLGLI